MAKSSYPGFTIRQSPVTIPHVERSLIRSLELPGVTKLRSGKVREVFDLGDKLLFVATDRLSAFDVILPDPIPDKGAVLNQLSAFWFQRFAFASNHMIAVQFDLPNELLPFREQLARRSMI